MHIKRLLSLAVSFLLAVLFSLSLPVFPKAEAGNTLKDYDEQRAANLTPAQLEQWAGIKKYEFSYDLVTDNSSGQIYLVCTVIHKDTAGKIYKKLISGGKTALQYYVQGVDEALNNLPSDLIKGEIERLEDIPQKLDDAGTENALSLESATDAILAAMEAGNDLGVISKYYYQLTSNQIPTVSSDFSVVMISATGRFYSASQFANDFLNGKTKDGYSIKKKTWGGIPGYYYKQQKITINKDKYWKILVIPMT